MQRWHDDSSVFFCALVIIFSIIFYIITCSTANANPVQLRYRNPGPTLAYDAIEVCQTDGCLTYAGACAPASECALVAELPRGFQETWLHARSTTLRSPESNHLTVYVPPVCKDYDSDGDKSITSVDFAAFLRGLMSSTWTVTDFAGFLRNFGGPCPE